MFRTLVVAVMLAAGAQPAHAHGEKQDRKKGAPAISTEEYSFGREGDPRKATRTVYIEMGDRMRFTPAELAVQAGETVRFQVKNSGKLMHEMVLGTLPSLTEHAAMMRKYPGMVHEEAYMVHVEPGKTGTMVWQFTRPGDFHYGCLVPGHFEAGMVGRVKVVPK